MEEIYSEVWYLGRKGEFEECTRSNQRIWEGISVRSEDVARREHKEGMFKRRELPGRFMARKLFGWSDKRYNQEYWERLKRNWRQWKEKWLGERKMEMIAKEEEIEEEKSGVRE